jgi:hypothetical protein
MLVDGLTKDALGGGDQYLRVDGTYLLGDYTFTGTISDKLGSSVSLPVDITFTLIQHKLSVSKTGTGSGSVSSNPSGIDCGTTCEFDFDYNTVVTLTATADTGSTFTGWTGEGCSGTDDCVVNMTAARSVTAEFTLNQYTLTAAKTGNGFGTVTSDPAGIVCGATCGHDFDYNTVVTLTVVADTGSTFTGWSGEGCSGSGKCVVTMTAARSVTAEFTLNTYLVNIFTSGSGSVSSLPAGIACGADCSEVYNYSTVVTLTAVAGPGWNFFGWSGDITSNSASVVVPVDANKTITATFAQNEYSLIVTKEGQGTVTVNPDQGSYHYGDTVNLAAQAAPGWKFIGWSGDLTVTDSSTSITIDGNKSVKALFVQYTIYIPIIRR